MNALLDNAIEVRRQSIQVAIDARKSGVERNRLGQFATPPALAIEIARYVESLLSNPHEDIHFADPSVGTGSFFSAAIAAFGEDHLKSAVGIEIDPAFADAAHNLWSESGLDVICGDFTQLVTESSRPRSPNLILANPPYIRHHHMNRADKERLQRIALKMTGIEVNGLAGLYVYFLLLATAWMEDDGYAAWLVPSEFMDVNYGSALRKFLTERITLLRCHRFDPDDVQFGDAIVSSVVVVFRKAVPPIDHAPEFTFGGTLSKPSVRDSIPLQRLRESRKWTGYPIHAKNDRQTIGDGSGPSLSDFFRIRRGIATGGNKFFILERNDAENRGLPRAYLRPILPSPRHLKTTVVEAGSDGYPALDGPLCVIDCDLPEPVVERRYPALWEYLQTAEELGIKEGYIVGNRTPWYKQELREPAPFLCTYMGRGTEEKRPFRFIHNRSRAIGTNLYLMLYPVRGLAEMLQKTPERAEEVHALLNNVSGRELRGEGRVYGGGMHKIEPSELGRISAAEFVKRWPELEEGTKLNGNKSLFD